MQWMSKALYNKIKEAKQDTFELNGWILITVELAKEFLKLNTNNYRTKKLNTVERYAKDMNANLWQKNGEAIVISKDGILRNGQHRLSAIVKSGKPTLMYMIFDADTTVIFDLPSKRTTVQILRDMGYSVSNLIPAVARVMLLGRVTTCNIGDATVCEYVIKNFELLKKTESIVRTKVAGSKLKIAGSKVGCASIVYSILKTGEMPEDELIDFFKVLNTDDKCGVKREVSAAKALRHQLDSYPGHGDNLSNRFMEYTYLALKDFHNNTKIDKNFIYSDGGHNAKRLIHQVQCMNLGCKQVA